MAVGGALVAAAGVGAGLLVEAAWAWQVAVALAVTAVAAAGCGLLLWRSRRELRRLRTLTDAEERFAAALDSHDARAATAAAVELLVPHGRLVELHLGAAPRSAEGLTGVLVTDALATGLPAVLPDGTTGRETGRLVALPIAAAGRRIGAVVLRLHSDADEGVADVQRLLRLVGPALAAIQAPPSSRDVDSDVRELVARGAHDLRTPLNTLSGMVDTLVRHGDDLPPATREEMHEALQRATRRIAGWITIMLDAALDEGQRRTRRVPTALQPLLEEAVTVTHAATAGLRVEVVPTDLYVFADPGTVVRVVSNLVANAGHHAGDGESVEVEARRRGRDVEVTVSDHGVGWGSDEDLGDGETHLSGLGLGLQSVRTQVAAWGGELELDETPGGGATVRFTVPGARAGTAQAEAAGEQNWTIAGRESLVRSLHRTP